METLTRVCLLICAMTALTGAAEVRVKRSILCPIGWTWIIGRCFRYDARPMTWATAEKACLSVGAHLASVHSFIERHAIQRLTRWQNEAWIGGSDAHEEGHWFWSDGSPFLYHHWCPGEPNNHNGNQDCLKMNHGGDNCWDDLQCARRLPFVCVKPVMIP